MLPSADQLFKDGDLIFQQDLAPAHTAKSSKSWLNDHGVGVLDWPEAIKPAQMKLSLAFSVFTSALCVSVCDIWCCLSIFIAVLMATKQQQDLGCVFAPVCII